ncbi:hypothetical protein GCM10027343_43820 [Noviherbaspirillum agri]
MKVRAKKRRIYISRIGPQVPLNVEDRSDFTRLTPRAFEIEGIVLDTSAANDLLGSAVTSAEFMAHLRLQAAVQIELDISTEWLLPEKEICNRLRLSPDALGAAVKAKQIFAIKGRSGEYYYPAFFAANRKSSRTMLKKVCAVLGDIPAGMKWEFFTTPRISLSGKNPVQAIARGKVAAVMDAAKALLED